MKKILPLFLLLLAPRPAASPPTASPIPVRFPEGVTHGFLLLRTLDSTLIARGDLLQSARGDSIETRMLFHFKDGSVLDEVVRFTQKDVFTMRSYHLVQRGPSFKDDTEIKVDKATGRYEIVTRDREDGSIKNKSGTLELPDDVYNGMVMLIVKNFQKGESRTVHYIAFTPEPRMIELEYSPVASTKAPPSDLPGVVVRYRLKPQLGIFLKVMSKILGKTPPDMYAWVVSETVPAFARFEGPLYMGGPIWRIETTGPRLPADSSMVASREPETEGS